MSSPTFILIPESQGGLLASAGQSYSYSSVTSSKRACDSVLKPENQQQYF
jgi:hypothetical protein